ncbi:hypothetical protein FN846DRAFT_524745 [Sphaerosporella brunnea]|uniref:Uncharacterized protein n=1 Tax=Sphaerosporella brunnea TaxID=1250544 RepID=A0A5J5F380_9PEZI|nr:hypothetical protein FN846DRAFT_524745 [Sphaerosporella brunnea]
MPTGSVCGVGAAAAATIHAVTYLFMLLRTAGVGQPKPLNSFSQVSPSRAALAAAAAAAPSAAVTMPHLSPTRQHQPTPFSTLSRLLLLCFGTNSTYRAAPTPSTWLLCRGSSY